MADFAAFLAVCAPIVAILRWRHVLSTRGKWKEDAAASLRETLVALSDPAEEWAFKAEGGANVALTYVGGEQRLWGHLLRVRKQRSHQPADSPAARSPPPSLPTLLPSDPLTYAHVVVAPLLGREYVIPGAPVVLPRPWMERLLSRVVLESPLRPPGRARAAGTLDAFLPPPRSPDCREERVGAGAVLMLDHSLLPRGWASGGPHVCVEVKPKGVLTHGGTPCRFCLHQLVKPFEEDSGGDGSEAMLAQRVRGTWRGGAALSPADAAAARAAVSASASRYCPQHLFSGDTAAIAAGIAALARRAGNNLRVFVGGVPVPTRRGGLDVPLPDAVHAALAGTAWAAHGDAWGAVSAALAAVLASDAVLPRVAAVQRLDRAGPRALLRRLVDRFPGVAADACAWEAAVCSLPLDDPLRRDAAEYMVAATAKDCSLLVAMAAAHPGSDAAACSAAGDGAQLGDAHAMRHRCQVEVPAGGSGASLRVVASCAVVDLDPKPLARLHRHAALEEELERCWRTSGELLAPADWLATRPCYPPRDHTMPVPTGGAGGSGGGGAPPRTTT
jgi:hypothetical protein